MLSSTLRSSVKALRPLRASRDLSYGFIGLGRMGLPMALNLQKKLLSVDGDSTVNVFDMNKAALAQISKDVDPKGAKLHVLESAVDVANKSDVIFTMLPEPVHVKGVYTDLVNNLGDKTNKIFVDCSTIDTKTSIDCGKLVTAKDASAAFVDAPVSGGVVGAEKGTLTFMVGCNKDKQQVYKQVEELLKLMGGRIVNCGTQGQGLAAKLANNYLLAVTNVATAEAFHLAEKLGCDLKLFSDIVNSSSGRSWSSEVNNPVPGVNPATPSSREYVGGFGINLMRKDLGLAIDVAKQSGSSMLIGDKTYAVYQDIEKGENYQGKDMSVIYKFLQDQDK